MSRTRLNILYIMSDDHSAEAISCYSSRLAPAFRTPNLDRIGREGLRLECFYSTNSILHAGTGERYPSLPEKVAKMG